MGPIREMLAESGVTEQQWRVLRVLHEAGKLDASTLAERAALHLPSQTRIVQTLSQKGYVERGADPDDRRRLVVEITDEGRALLAGNREASLRLASDLEQRFGAEDMALLLDLLEKLDRV
ncbi:MarR family transcriptional regulator [Roseibium sp.]|uniref:MarR family transcriptional regulator n=1 Tax=Roseibium sp. TaxID=1936156 RepID=UPI003A98497C